LTPTSSSEWSSFSGLYDEYKVHGVTSKGIVSVAGTIANLNGGSELAVMAYDPVGSSALGATVDGCVYSQHHLSSAYGNTGVSLTAQSATTPPGLFSFGMKVPQGGFVADSATPTNVVGGWSATSSTDSAGYLKRYIPALGANIATNVLEILFFDVTFRNRQ
jgi:hypothetical protein